LVAQQLVDGIFDGSLKLTGAKDTQAALCALYKQCPSHAPRLSPTAATVQDPVAAFLRLEQALQLYGKLRLT
jgi:hypothetical protein